MTAITSGRYTKKLRLDLGQQVEEFAQASSDTLEEEAILRWIMAEFVQGYSEDQISLDQLYTNLLVGVETLSKAIQRRLDIQYRKERLVTPEQLMIIFRLIGSILDSRISNRQECLAAANDIAALIQGHAKILEQHQYEHPQIEMGAASAVEAISDVIPQ
jgi:hypothetical protein